jgi:hypothetical protein
MGVFKKVVGETGNILKEKLTDPMVLVGGLITGLVKTFKDIDKAAGDTARGMTRSYSEAVKFRGELKGAADASNSQYITSKGLLETISANDSISGTYFDDFLKDNNSSLVNLITFFFG